MAMAIQKRPGFARPHPNKAWLRFSKRIPLLTMVIPGLVFVAIFNYYPMLGLQIAFKDYHFATGIWHSSWNGLANFDFLRSPDFWQSVRNTFTLTVVRLLIGFPAPIILALMMNEILNNRFKRVIQTISYMPHFVSWIVIAGILFAFLNTDSGVINQVFRTLGLKTVNFMGRPQYFPFIFWGSGLWKEIGWGTIIYLATIAGINTEMYEAAKVDGAGKLAQIRYITVPSMMSTISILLVLSIPGLLAAGYDQIYPLINPGNMGAAEVIDTYVVRLGLSMGLYATTTAIGFIMSILASMVVLTANFTSARLGGERLF